MWICLNNAFFSIVQPGRGKKSLLVRARRRGDIERVFGESVEVSRTPGRDYLWRALIDRKLVAKVIADQVLNIDYGNFKNSVADDDLHRAYSSFWSIHGRMQEVAPYSRQNRRDLFGGADV